MNNSAVKKTRENGDKMTCSEFQKILPYLYESGGTAQGHEHLKSCEICSDLVADLNYIAQQAKLLLPLRDPSPKVWNNIQNSLEREGLIKEGQSAQPRLVTSAKKKL